MLKLWRRPFLRYGACRVSLKEFMCSCTFLITAPRSWMEPDPSVSPTGTGRLERPVERMVFILKISLVMHCGAVLLQTRMIEFSSGE